MNTQQLRNLTERVLKAIELYSPEAVELVLGTIAQESRMGEYIRQLNNGPALGVCQMEPATFEDIKRNFLRVGLMGQHKLVDKILIATNTSFSAEELEYNLAFAIAMCRIHYLRQPGAIPTTVEGQAQYWKDYYNTHLGMGTVTEYIINYNKFVK